MFDPLILDIETTYLSNDDKTLISHPCVGGLILFSRNFSDLEQLQELVAAIRQIKPELLLCVDHEGGRVQRFREGFTPLPAMQRLGDTFEYDPNLAKIYARELGWLMAIELLSIGIDLSFAPVLDLDKSFSDIIGDRAFSANPDIAIELAGKFIQGMTDAGMKATGKHFPGHGSVVEDSHLALPVDTRSRSELDKHDLLPFKALMNQLRGMMPAHIVFPEIDAQPVGFSKVWLQQVLRTELGFDGVIFSDDLSMEGAAILPSYTERAQAALNAGCDSILVCNNRNGAVEVVESLERWNNPPAVASLGTMRPEQVAVSRVELQSSQRFRDALDIVSALQ